MIEPLPRFVSPPIARQKTKQAISRRLPWRPKTPRQRSLPFLERTERLERSFKIAIAAATIGLAAIVLGAFPAGRFWTSWLATRTRWLALRSVGIEPDRSEIDAEWRRKRDFDVEQARGTLPGTFAEYSPAAQRLLRFAGLDPEHALVRWGNFDRTVLLPATVFEADDSGRSYRFRPNVRSIWIRNFPVRGQVKAYFQVPDTPDAAEMVKGTGAQVVAGSTQTTNSWRLRGPEPDLNAPWRGIVLGDSYMQGLFVGDQETPTECLKRDLRKRLHAPVEILNTGHLGYSPEQYYFTLLEYAARFPPRFVVVSLFANDFNGDVSEALQGRGDWAEGAYWLEQIRDSCTSRGLICLFVPAPYVNQIEQPQMAGHYPGLISNSLQATAVEFLDPIYAFANAQLALQSEAKRTGQPALASPLFNGRVGDAHFSAQGSAVWAAAVGERLALWIESQTPRTTAAEGKRQGVGSLLATRKDQRMTNDQ